MSKKRKKSTEILECSLLDMIENQETSQDDAASYPFCGVVGQIETNGMRPSGTSRITEKAVLTKKQEKRPSGLVVFTKEDLQGMVPVLFDEALSGDFYIASGYIVSSVANNGSADIVIANNEKQMKLTITDKDSFYKKILSVSPGRTRISMLMRDNCQHLEECGGSHCVDIKLGPIFGMVGWEFKKKNSSGKVTTEFFVKA